MKKTRKHSGVKKRFYVKNMTCTGCERIIKKQAMSVAGVKGVKADYSTGLGEITYDPSVTDFDTIMDKIAEKGYTYSHSDTTKEKSSPRLPGVSIALGILVILVGGYFIMQNQFDLSSISLDPNTSIAMLFVIGLFTGFHCIAMCGGFVVSYTSKQAAEEQGLNFKSHLTYGFGKTLSYTMIGALFGLVGSYLTFTPALRGAAAILAGLFLMLFGLNMLGLLTWFRKFRLKTPGFIEQAAFKLTRGNSSPLAIGLLNGLMIACGPLQAVYLLAAASGSAYYGALYLLAFGLGTLPVMLGFGLLTSVVSGQLTHRILRFSGVVVILLGFVMLNRGLALTGAGYDLASVAASVSDAGGGVQNASVSLTPEGFQEIRMNVTAYGWQPDRFVLKKGVPVRWVIDGQRITNCNKAIQVPKLGLEFDVKPGLQTIEFTPNEAGVIPWSCWMGMIQGSFIVKDDIDLNNTAEVQEELAAVTLPKSTGGCGCGG